MRGLSRSTVRDLLLRLDGALFAAVENSRLEAELILRHVLGVSRSGLYLILDEDVDPADLERIGSIARRRMEGEPLQYLLGSAGFFGLELEVREGVLVPRPETEILVERAIRFLGGIGGNPEAVDLGTGSGAIAIAIAVSDPRVRVTATDISSVALEVAERNARRYDVADRIAFLRGDLFEPLRHLKGSVDLIASNPPYIPQANMRDLPIDVRREPREALSAGRDGLNFFRRIADKAPGYLKAGGIVILEVGDGQAERVADLLERAGLSDVSIARDLRGHERVVSAKRAAEAVA